MYCTRNDIEQTRIPTARLLELVDDEGLQIDSDEVVGRIEAAIADASAKIDAMLNGAYSTPLSSPAHPLITSLATDIAAFRLWSRREGEPPKTVIVAYTDAIRTLEMLRREKLAGNDMLYAAAQQADSLAMVDAPEAQFSPPKLAGML